MDLADIGKPEEEEEGKSCEDKSINIDISLIMGKMGGRPHPDFGDKEDEEENDDTESPMEKACLPESFDEDDDCTDWKSIAKQLIQAVSMMDTHTDGVNSGTEDPDGALKAIDNETSRILWGKQEEDNPRSSYQNANYGQTTANGMVMTNPAEVCNKDAYEEDEGKDTEPKPFKHPTAPPSDKPAPIPPSVIKQAEKEDDLFDAKHDDEDDDAEDMAEDKKEAAKGFPPKTNGFKKAAEGIIKKGKNKNKFDDVDEPDDLDDPDESDDQFDNKKMR